MKLLIKLAWRNIWRNKRRSLLTLAAIVFASLAAIAMRGIQLGTFSLNIKNAVELFSGYIQIQDKGYLENPTLNASFKVNDKMVSALKSTPGVLSYSPRIYADGLICFKNNSSGVSIMGIQPGLEKNVTTFQQNIDRGKFFESDSTNEIVLGSKLMDNLNAKIGDEVILLSQGYDGTLGNQKFKITGTVKIGARELESAVTFMGLKTSQSLLGMGPRISVIAIKAEDIERLKGIKDSLTRNVNNPNLSVLLWNEVSPEMQQQINLSNIRGILFNGILIVIVAFGILNTVLMSVTERFKEFGVVLSIGMPQLKLTYIIYIETFFITIIGLLLGNIIGFAVNYYFVIHPIVFGGELKKLYEMYHYLPLAQSSVQFSIFLNVSLSIIIISLLACVYPAYKVYKLEPLKGIRHT
ncbi:MAG: FtsX-like permease family protein [Ignavibacteriaceae bacterium]